jgi:CRISPR-associated protein Csb2
MLTLSLTFPGGRYHATPWGRHVNEADVAWPPDPWRLSRALIASWHRKLDQQRFPRELLESLLAALAGEAPHYRLPLAVHAHTRHYMPNRQKSTLIFDAFARINSDDELIVHWPELVLANSQTLLLDALLAALGYLGRAESWIEAKRLPEWNGELNCCPGETAIDLTTGEVSSEPVHLYVPLPPAEYEDFCRHFHQGLEARRLSKKELAQINATLKQNWLDALSLDTADLQAAGWSAPPSAKKLLYQRPIQALRSSVTGHPRPRIQPPADTVRYAIYGKPLARVEDTLKFGEWLRIAALGKAKRVLGEDAIPALLSGHGLPDENRHEHAFFIPEADNQGRIAHAVIHIPGGFDSDIRRVLENLDKVWNREGQEWQLILEHIGEKSSFAQSVPVLKQSPVWQSRTPYLHPWHCKKNFDIEAQIRRECRERGLPEITELQPQEAAAFEGRRLRPVDYHRFRSKRGLIQPDRHGSFWRITFAEPVAGPLLLGFGCHFGLGLFMPGE